MVISTLNTDLKEYRVQYCIGAIATYLTVLAKPLINTMLLWEPNGKPALTEKSMEATAVEKPPPQ